MEDISEVIKKRKLKQQKEYENYVIDHTKEYIQNYLNPNLFFIKGTSIECKIESIMYDIDLDNEMICDYIKTMNYKDFLDTPYWEGVTLFAKNRANYQCEKCNKNGVLNVHHKTYINHGKEHIKSVARQDLIVLCKDCHQEEHNIEDTREVN